MLKKLNHALWPAVTGLLLALGLVLPALCALDFPAYASAVRACLLTAVCAALWGMGGAYTAAGLAVGCAGAAAYLFTGGRIARLGGMLGAALPLFGGVTAPLQVYAPEVAVLLGVLMTLAGWALALRPGGFIPALSLEMIVGMACWAGGMRENAWFFAPGLAALLALLAQMAHESAPRGPALAAASVAVCAALLLTPLAAHTSKTLSGLAEAIHNYIADTFFFTETRTVYSIEVDGYMPLETRLGGAAEPSDRPVMTVETDGAVLLRGSIYNRYTGLSWRNTLSSRRYRYQSARNEKLRGEATDSLLPQQALRQSELFAPHSVSVTMNADSASTLFSMLRMENLTTPMSLVPYFSTSSEIFITRDLEAGDAYSFCAPVLSSEDARLDEVLALAAQSAEKKDMSAYLQLPSAIGEDVYALAEKLTAGCATPLEKARAIRTYLYYNMAYTLSPETPPDMQDFVSYFLLTGKEGYCTYFASAMAVLGRMAGLPTRYVEGYLVQPSGGVALVTGKDAHAWAEVWFDGFGWVAFDATPPHGEGSSDESTPPHSGESPDDMPDESPESNPPQTPESAAGDFSPTSSPEPPADSPDEPPQQPDAPSPEKKHGNRWWLWLLLVLLAALLALRIWQTTPAQAAKRLTRPDEKLLLWYLALLGLLAAAGLGAMPSESPTAHALRIAEKLPQEANYLDVADALTMLGYGRFGASPAQAEQAAACYRALCRSLPFRARAVWFVRRVVFGIGGVEQVP